MKAWLVLGFLLLTKFLCVDCRNDLTFSIKPPSQIIGQANANLTILCQGDGHPPPRVSWRRYGSRQLDSSRTKIEGDNLTIYNLNKTDQGEYECCLHNVTAQNFSTFSLIVQGTTPHKPTMVLIKPFLNYLNIYYTPGYDGGHNATFMTAYRNAELKTKWKTHSIEPNDNGISYYHYFSIIRNLIPNTQYEVRIWAKNQIGDGECSPNIFIKTANTPRKERFSAHKKKIVAIGVVIGLIVFIGALTASVYLVRKQIRTKDEKLINEEDQLSDED